MGARHRDAKELVLLDSQSKNVADQQLTQPRPIAAHQQQKKPLTWTIQLFALHDS